MVLAASCKQGQSSSQSATPSVSKGQSKEETEECGTLMKLAGKFTLQMVGGNSRDNGNREIEAQDGATLNLLNSLRDLDEVCIIADFSDPDEPILLKSAKHIRKMSK
jgi:hypothetical protein